MRNYFNPAWINDLKERVFRAVKEIEEKHLKTSLMTSI